MSARAADARALARRAVEYGYLRGTDVAAVTCPGCRQRVKIEFALMPWPACDQRKPAQILRALRGAVAMHVLDECERIYV